MNIKMNNNTMQIQKFTFNDQVVEFDLKRNSLMINATQMGKIFDKLPKDFLKNESTKLFIADPSKFV